MHVEQLGVGHHCPGVATPVGTPRASSAACSAANAFLTVTGIVAAEPAARDCACSAMVGGCVVMECLSAVPSIPAMRRVTTQDHSAHRGANQSALPANGFNRAISTMPIKRLPRASAIESPGFKRQVGLCFRPANDLRSVGYVDAPRRLRRCQ
jgi:hypothetical protein